MNIEPFWLPRLRRTHRHRTKINPAASAANTTEPTTIPAMAPPDKPFFELLAVAEADGCDEEVDVGSAVKVVIKPVSVGSFTPAHLFSAPEL